MKVALSNISEIRLHQLAEQKKQTPPMCSLPSVPKRSDVAASSLTTPKALYVLPSGHLCPNFITSHSGVQFRCNQSAKLWSMSIIQGDCCSPQDSFSLTGCGQFFTLCQPLHGFTQLHLASDYQGDSGALNEGYAGKRFPEYKEVRKICHAGYLSFENVRTISVTWTVSKHTLQGFHVSMLRSLHHAVDGRSQ